MKLAMVISSCCFEPIGELGIAATLLDEAVQSVTTIAPALVAGDAQHIELTDEVAEDGCTVAGHWPQGER